MAGAAPVYVQSVTRGGPCDSGADGLVAGDVILKVVLDAAFPPREMC